jgi:hypothetical protein
MGGFDPCVTAANHDDFYLKRHMFSKCVDAKLRIADGYAIRSDRARDVAEGDVPRGTLLYFQNPWVTMFATAEILNLPLLFHVERGGQRSEEWRSLPIGRRDNDCLWMRSSFCERDRRHFCVTDSEKHKIYRIAEHVV